MNKRKTCGMEMEMNEKETNERLRDLGETESIRERLA